MGALPPQPATSPIVPDSAPFTAEQRHWLNGFFAGLLSTHAVPAAALAEAAVALTAGRAAPAPWHNPSLSLGERMMLAESRPLAQRMMAALAQQDCRQCGYDCETYADAMAASTETRLDLCVPGGKDTARMLSALLGELDGGRPAFDAEAHRRALAVKFAPPPPEPRPGYDRNRPVLVSLESRRALCSSHSEKAAYHVEIALGDSALEFEPGDALGIYPENDLGLVDLVICAIGAPADYPILDRTLRDVLTENISLGTPPDALFQLIACITGGEARKRAKQLAAGEDPDGDAASLDVLAALEKFPGIRPDPEAFIESLEELRPRYYSIASSLRAEPGKVALTVDHVRYTVKERQRQGVASSWLSERAPIGSRVKAFIQHAPHFRLPRDGETPIVMIGPGTGIAPFRAFLQERRMRGAKGQAWLFFGHRHRADNFLYEEELERFRAEGVLTRLSCAWSRDDEDKSYVQHRMLEEAETLWDWLYDGAHLYVCGDAKKMAAAVEETLIEIIADWGNRDQEAAAAYMETMKKAGRYQKDVY